MVRKKKGIGEGVIQNLKQNLLELIVFALVVGLLAVGAHLRNRLWIDAVDLWKDSVLKSPRKARPYINLGYAYLNSGDYEKALKTTHKAIQINPRSGEAYYNLSAIYQKWGDLKKAIEMGEKSIELDPSLDMVYFTLGVLYSEDRQYDRAEASYKRFIRIYPYFPEVHNRLAVVYGAQRRFDKAIEAFEGEIRVNPYDSLAHLNLGQIYWYEFKDRDKALSNLRAALAIDPFLPDRTKVKRLLQRIEESPS